MRFLKATAVAAALLFAVAPVTSCNKDKKGSSSSYVLRHAEGENIAKQVATANVAQEVNANQTLFTINKVIDAGALGENGEHFLYLDITVKNDTDVEYTLSTLNNFYIVYPDDTEYSSGIHTQLYAINHFNDRYFTSPFTVKANSTFNGVVGGFALKDIPDEFTVGFFPTREDRDDKEDLIKVKITSDDIIEVPAALKKQ